MRALAELVSTLVMSATLTTGARTKRRRHGTARVELPAEHEGHDLVEIVPKSRKQLDAIISMRAKFNREDFETLSPDQILVWTTKDTRAALEKAGFQYAPAEDPNSRVLSNYTYKSGSQEWDQYCEYDCMTSRLQDISATCGYPLESIGQSVDGREIWALTIGPGEPTVLMGGGIHGDETTGVQFLQRWMWETCFEPSAEQAAIAESAVVYIPMLNPDGYERVRRSNAAGVDLNRNFPSPGESDSTAGRQPETVAYMNYVSSKPSLKVSSMSHGGVVVINYAYDSCYRNIPGETPCGSDGSPPALTPDDAWAQELARSWTFPDVYNCLYEGCITNGASWYEITGGLQDYNYWHKGIMDITLEVSRTKRPRSLKLPGLYDTQYQAMVNFIQTANRGPSA